MLDWERKRRDMFCPKCGKEQKDNARFCPGCGAENKSTSAEAKGGAEAGAALSASSSAPDAPSPTPSIQKPKKKTGLIVGVIAAVVVVAAVLVFVFVNPFAKVTLEDAKVGDLVHLGEVSFTASGGDQFKKDISWRVLAVENDQVLVISEDIIDLRPYNIEQKNITWEQSTIRTWLNGTFFEGLPQSMKDRVQTTQVTNNNNPDYGTSGGANTNDKVFLLSIDEANKYFSSDRDRQTGVNLSTGTIKAFKDRTGDDIKGIHSWWLRSPGSNANYVAYVGGIASAIDGGDPGVVDTGGGKGPGGNVFVDGGVRPALWLSR